MKMNTYLLIAALIGAFAQDICAQTLKVQNGSENLEKVPLATAATTADGGKLNYVGAGLRSKKVVFVNVKVYVGQFFVGDLSKFKKNSAEALASVTEASPVAIQLHFLRDVDAEKVQSSFKEALEANKVDFKKPEMDQFLAAVKNSGAAKEGKSLTILGKKIGDGRESIIYEDVNGSATVIHGATGFIQNVFSIWLGHPSDDGVAKLKNDILK